MKLITLVFGMVVIAVAVAAGQAPAQKPAFEVASIKPNATSSFQIDFDASKGRFVGKNITALILLEYAFDRQLSQSELARGTALFARASAIQVVGGPAWLREQHFDIEAKPPGNSEIPQREMQLMMQLLLEDRFQLKAHYETRESPVYNLVVAKPGRMKLSADQTPPPAAIPDGTNPGTLLRGRMRTLGKPGPAGMGVVMSGTGISLSTLRTLLQSYLDRTVLDRTKLQGLFDIQTEFTLQSSSPAVSAGAAGGNGMTSAADPQGTSIFSALQEDLGLKLESSKGPVEVLVLDSVSRPTEN